MNRADRRRTAKLEKSGKKPAGSSVNNAIAAMINPIVTLLNAQEFGRAEEALTELLAAAPDHAEAHHLYGLLLGLTQRDEQAIAALKRATELSPGIALYWHNLATSYSRQRQFGPAIEHARRAMALDASYADPQSLLVSLLAAEGQEDEALDMLASLVQLRGDDVNLWLQLGRGRIEQRRQAEAVPAFERALELKPDDINLMREASNLLMNNWEYDKATKLRQRADELAAKNKN